jgi:CRISPR-associated protein Cmr2
MTTDWYGLLLAYLHDPPDKALSIRGHVGRARNNAQIAVGPHVSKGILEDAVSAADPLASIIERLPMPTAGPNGERAVGPQASQIRVIHPLSTAPVSLTVPELNDELTAAEQQQLRALVADLPGEGDEQARNRFLAIWRLWPDSLAESCHSCLRRLPADTRTPDHTIWHHLDITAAFKAAEAEGQGSALLTFAIGPVQPFIQAARSVRDLWSGSMILAWLAFRAMLPIIEQLGPAALIYPALRGIPLMDLWLRHPERLGDKVPALGADLRQTPSLPHRFLALVPWGTDGTVANRLAAQCREAAAGAWQEMAACVKKSLEGTFRQLCSEWDKRWDSQVTDYFSTATAVLPRAGAGEGVDRRLALLLSGQGSFADAFRDAEAVRQLARSIPASDQPGYPQDHAGRWQYQVEVAQRSLAAQRAVRQVPPMPPRADPNQKYPEKCTLLGSFEQMGPDGLHESKDFWARICDAQQGVKLGGVRLRKGEALSAVALVKRFAAPAFLTGELGLTMEDVRFSDTWTIARAAWLHNAQIDPDEIRKQHGDWNGQWLHWQTEQDDREEPRCPGAVLATIKQARDTYGQAPTYYAILKLDGDDLGGWLRGKNSPNVRKVMHPKLVEYYEQVGTGTKAGLDAKRPVGPALHAAISTALSNFGLYVVPEVVEKHHGRVIYSGGDDTLVLLPVSTALRCAIELSERYRSDWYQYNGRELLLMGSRATLSGGLVVLHAKDDLRLALQDARLSETQAKESGRDALAIRIRRRSGEHTTSVCPWSFVARVGEWTAAFRQGASDRWVYRLYADRPTLEHLAVGAMEAEMRRHLKRAEEPIPAEEYVETFDQYRTCWLAEPRRPQGREFLQRYATREEQDAEINRRALKSFLTLTHTASFLGRERDA